MCNQCDYKELIAAAGIDPTKKRLQVLEIVGNNSYPLSATEIFDTVNRNQPINRVTVYRILDLLVENEIVERISTGGRAAYYGLAPNEHHKAHPHFYCKSCGQMDCLNANALSIEMEAFRKTFPGRIDKLEIRVDGICKNCLRNEK